MADLPLVSVVIPAFNAENHVAGAIESVLDQTYPHVEVIVVDDGSTDQTVARVQSFSQGVRLVRKPNGGPASARNAGISAARGEYVGLLDSDDRWRSTCLETQVGLLEGDPDALMAAGDMAVRFEDGRPETTWFKWWKLPVPPQGTLEPSFGDLFRRNTVATSTVVIRRHVFSDVGLFDEAIPFGCEDLDLWLRIAAIGKVIVHSVVVAERLQHDSSLSSGPGALTDSYVAVLHNVRRHFPELLRKYELDVTARIAHTYFLRGYRYFDLYDFPSARKDFLRSIRVRPGWRSVGYFLATLLGRRVVGTLRGVKRRRGRRGLA